MLSKVDFTFSVIPPAYPTFIMLDHHPMDQGVYEREEKLTSAKESGNIVMMVVLGGILTSSQERHCRCGGNVEEGKGTKDLLFHCCCCC